MIDAAAWQQYRQAHLAHPQAQPGYPQAPHGHLQAPHGHHPQYGQAGAAPPVRAGRHNVRSYDMTAATTRDAMVRRIIWIALLVIAMIVAAVMLR